MLDHHLAPYLRLAIGSSAYSIAVRSALNLLVRALLGEALWCSFAACVLRPLDYRMARRYSKNGTLTLHHLWRLVRSALKRCHESHVQILSDDAPFAHHTSS
jgi:hypothetical protein